MIFGPHPHPLPSEWAREFFRSKKSLFFLPSPVYGSGKGEGALRGESFEWTPAMLEGVFHLSHRGEN
jgi:hypothetical protein